VRPGARRIYGGSITKKIGGSFGAVEDNQRSTEDAEVYNIS